MLIKSIAENRTTASRSLAQRLAQVLKNAISERGEATLVVSGGTSPDKMFEILSEYELDWQKVTVIPSDERVVSSDDPARNDRMIRQSLCQNSATSAHVLSLLNDEGEAAESIEKRNLDLQNISAPIDAVVLGMGDDGHTASLFPDAPHIEEALASNDNCILQKISRLPHDRISLTTKMLLNAHEVHLLFFGEEKYEVLKQALQPGPAAEYPVRAVLHQSQVPVAIHWAP